MKSCLDLPDNWVYIEYEDGEQKNVANTDTLSKEKAARYKKRWEEGDKKGRKIVKVMLKDNDSTVIESFTF